MATAPAAVKSMFKKQQKGIPRDARYPAKSMVGGLGKAMQTLPYKKVPQVGRGLGETAAPETQPIDFTDKEIKAAFQLFDVGRENRVGTEELRHLLCTVGIPFTEEDLEMMVGILDVNATKSVHYEEFFQFFRQPEAVFLHPVIGNLMKRREDEARLKALSEEEAAAEAAEAAAEEERVEHSATKELGGLLGGSEDGLNVTDVKRLYKEFQKADADNSGYLDYHEFCNMLNKKANEETLKIFKYFDQDDSGSIELKEFAIGLTMCSAAPPHEKLKMAFQVFDSDGSGMLEYGELLQLLQSTFSLSDQELSDKAAEGRCKAVYQYLKLPDRHDLNFDQYMEVAKQKAHFLLPLEQLQAMGKLTN